MQRTALRAAADRFRSALATLRVAARPVLAQGLQVAVRRALGRGVRVATARWLC
jgi:hypothetical protein